MAVADEAPAKRCRVSDAGRSRQASSRCCLAAAGLLALAETPAAAATETIGAAVPTPAEQAASRAHRAQARAMQWADDAGAIVLPPQPPASPQFDASNPFAAGTLKSACWSVLELAGAAGLSTSAIVTAVAAAGLMSWDAARTPANSVTAALGQETANFVRIAPSTYALRKELPGAGTPRPHISPPPPPVAAPAVSVEQTPEETIEAAEAPQCPAALMALSLNQLRDAFLAVCGRATKSKNKAWMRSRLSERGFTGGDLACAPAECADLQPPATC